MTEVKDSRPFTYDPRTRLAAERTLLAWIRTGISLMGFGFIVARFGLLLREVASLKGNAPVSSSSRLSLLIGVSLVGLGVLSNLSAARQHRRFVRMLSDVEGEHSFAGAYNSLILALVVAAIGMGLVGYLFNLDFDS